jgi:hypothetical protein
VAGQAVKKKYNYNKKGSFLTFKSGDNARLLFRNTECLSVRGTRHVFTADIHLK